MFADLGYALCVTTLEHLGIGKSCIRGRFWCVSVSINKFSTLALCILGDERC
jgi:hypothetical protein